MTLWRFFSTFIILLICCREVSLSTQHHGLDLGAHDMHEFSGEMKDEETRWTTLMEAEDDLEWCNLDYTCLNGGSCVNGRCVCVSGWFHRRCNGTAKEVLPIAWTFYVVTFSIVFSIIVLLSLVQLSFFAASALSKWGSFAWTTPRILWVIMMSSVLIGGLSRVFYLTIDPVGYKHIVPRLLNALFYQTALGCVLTAYTVLLSVWWSLMQLSGNASDRFAGSLTASPNASTKTGYGSLTLISHQVLLGRTSDEDTRRQAQHRLIATISMYVSVVFFFIMIWGVTLPSAVLFSTLPLKDVKTYKYVNSSVFGIYVICISLVFAISSYRFYSLRLSVQRYPQHFKLSRRLSIITLVAILLTILLWITVASVIFGNEVWPYAESPSKYVTFESLWRVEEAAFELIILIFSGKWKMNAWKSWLMSAKNVALACIRRRRRRGRMTPHYDEEDEGKGLLEETSQSLIE